MRAGDGSEKVFEQIFAETSGNASSLDRREQKVRSEFWDKLKRVAKRLPFIDDLVASYYCAMDPETPLRVRGMLLAALAYFILPVDIVPDLIAGLGFTDDAAVLATVVGMVSGHITPKHRVAAAKALDKDLSEVDLKD